MTEGMVVEKLYFGCIRESVAVFYNHLCGYDSDFNYYAQNKMCVNFVYDLNGKEGQNEVGKDVGFITEKPCCGCANTKGEIRGSRFSFR